MKAAPGLNLNTVLLGIVLALAGWTCKTVVEMGTTLATTVERVSGHESSLTDIKARTSYLEQEVGNLRVRVGKPIATSEPAHQ